MLLATSTTHKNKDMILLVRETESGPQTVAIREYEFPAVVREALRLGWAVKADK